MQTAGQAEPIKVGAIEIRFLVEAEQSGGSVSVFECDIPADARVPAAHSHDGFEETVYGLRGVTTYTIDGKAIDIGPGDSLCVPRGVVHGFENRGGDDATVLVISTPGVFGPAYFRDVGDVLAAASGGPPNRAALAEVMRGHGLTPAPPAGR